MKKMITILGTVLLGIFIVVSIIMSDTGLKGNANSIKTKSNSVIDEVININPTP
jgi:hypothetical protein